MIGLVLFFPTRMAPIGRLSGDCSELRIHLPDRGFNRSILLVTVGDQMFHLRGWAQDQRVALALTPGTYWAEAEDTVGQTVAEGAIWCE